MFVLLVSILLVLLADRASGRNAVDGHPQEADPAPAVVEHSTGAGIEGTKASTNSVRSGALVINTTARSLGGELALGRRLGTEPLSSMPDVEGIGSEQNSLNSPIGTPLLLYGSAAGYPTRMESEKFMKRLVSSAYGTLTGHTELDRTQEYDLPIHMYCLGRCPAKLDADLQAPVRRPEIKDGLAPRGVHELLLNALHHAREPMTLEALLLFTRRQIEAVRAGVPEAQALWSTRAAWLVPIVNVDGYEYNAGLLVQGEHSTALQRKNRHVVGKDRCKEETYNGVDINRNYAQFFKQGDPQMDTRKEWEQPCGEVYRGARAFSESEPRALRDFLSDRYEAGQVALEEMLAAGSHGFGPGRTTRTRGGRSRSRRRSVLRSENKDAAGGGAGAAPRRLQGLAEPYQTGELYTGLSVALNLHAYGESINTPPGPKGVHLPPGIKAHVQSLAAGLAHSGGSVAEGRQGKGWEWGTAYEIVQYYVGGEASDHMLYQHGVLAYSPEVGPPFRRGSDPDFKIRNDCMDLPPAAKGNKSAVRAAANCFMPYGKEEEGWKVVASMAQDVQPVLQQAAWAAGPLLHAVQCDAFDGQGFQGDAPADETGPLTPLSAEPRRRALGADSKASQDNDDRADDDADAPSAPPYPSPSDETAAPPQSSANWSDSVPQDERNPVSGLALGRAGNCTAVQKRAGGLQEAREAETPKADARLVHIPGTRGRIPADSTPPMACRDVGLDLRIRNSGSMPTQGQVRVGLLVLPPGQPDAVGGYLQYRDRHSLADGFRFMEVPWAGQSSEPGNVRSDDPTLLAAVDRDLLGEDAAAGLQSMDDRLAADWSASMQQVESGALAGIAPQLTKGRRRARALQAARAAGALLLLLDQEQATGLDAQGVVGAEHVSGGAYDGRLLLRAWASEQAGSRLRGAVKSGAGRGRKLRAGSDALHGGALEGLARQLHDVLYDRPDKRASLMRAMLLGFEWTGAGDGDGAATGGDGGDRGRMLGQTGGEVALDDKRDGLRGMSDGSRRAGGERAGVGGGLDGIEARSKSVAGALRVWLDGDGREVVELAWRMHESEGDGRDSDRLIGQQQQQQLGEVGQDSENEALDESEPTGQGRLVESIKGGWSIARGRQLSDPGGAGDPSNSTNATSNATATASSPSVFGSPSNTSTPSISSSPSNTSTPSISSSPSNTSTPSISSSPSNTSTPSISSSPSNTSTPSISSSPSNTSTPSISSSPSNTSTPSSSSSPSNTSAPSSSSSPSNTSAPSISSSPSTSPTPSSSSSPSTSPTPSVSASTSPNLTSVTRSPAPASPPPSASRTPVPAVEEEPCEALRWAGESTGGLPRGGGASTAMAPLQGGPLAFVGAHAFAGSLLNMTQYRACGAAAKHGRDGLAAEGLRLVARSCAAVNVSKAIADEYAPAVEGKPAVARLAIADRDTCVLYDIKPSGRLAGPRRLLPEHPACVEVLGPSPEEGGSTDLPFPAGSSGEGAGDGDGDDDGGSSGIGESPIPSPSVAPVDPSSSTPAKASHLPAPSSSPSNDPAAAVSPVASSSPEPDDYAEKDDDGTAAPSPTGHASTGTGNGDEPTGMSASSWLLLVGAVTVVGAIGYLAKTSGMLGGGGGEWERVGEGQGARGVGSGSGNGRGGGGSRGGQRGGGSRARAQLDGDGIVAGELSEGEAGDVEMTSAGAGSRGGGEVMVRTAAVGEADSDGFEFDDWGTEEDEEGGGGGGGGGQGVTSANGGASNGVASALAAPATGRADQEDGYDVWDMEIAMGDEERSSMVRSSEGGRGSTSGGSGAPRGSDFDYARTAMEAGGTRETPRNGRGAGHATSVGGRGGAGAGAGSGGGRSGGGAGRGIVLPMVSFKESFPRDGSEPRRGNEL